MFFPAKLFTLPPAGAGFATAPASGSTGSDAGK
ncbi:MAG: hypothetical protein BWX68_03030 [Verrucomicrobia bacterium ADurb.Bin063]|nr:MAG: hypothetical protein BWX68_03030 [Verrucomicrobia bacterium ADurb.Bin063]